MRTTTLILAAAIAFPAIAQNPLMDQGRAALERRDFRAAARALEKVVDRQPGNAEAHYLLGNAYGRLAQTSNPFSQASYAVKTRMEFEKAVQNDPNHVLARIDLLQFYLQAPILLGGDETKAYQQAVEIKRRDSVLGHRAYALIYAHQKRPAQVREEYLAAVREQPDSADAHDFLAEYYLEQHAYRAAGEEFEKTVRLDPNNMPAWFYVGQLTIMNNGNLVHAEQALRRYLTYVPDIDEPPLARAYYWLGVIDEKSGREAEAQQKYMTSFRLDPEQRDVMRKLQK